MFPKVKVCSEIVDANNMRFMQFRANDQFSLQISKRERVSNYLNLSLFTHSNVCNNNRNQFKKAGLANSVNSLRIILEMKCSNFSG